MSMVRYRLFTPGPVELSPSILHDINQALPYHRDKAFKEVFERAEDSIKKVLLTKNSRVYFFSSSGTGAMEAAIVNFNRVDDEIIILSTGVFGDRWKYIAERYRLKVAYYTEEWGNSLDPERVEKFIKVHPKAKNVYTTLSETSTGAVNNIKIISQIAKKYGKLLIVDGIAGFGADPIRMDDWGIAGIVGGSQKTICAPPGIGFLAVSNEVEPIIEKSNLPKFYFDLSIYKDFLDNGFTPFTPSITIMLALAGALEDMASKSAEQLWDIYASSYNFLKEGVEEMGWEIFPKHPSHALLVLKADNNTPSSVIIERIRDREGILFANGQLHLKDKIIRIGIMCHTCTDDLNLILNALKRETRLLYEESIFRHSAVRQITYR